MNFEDFIKELSLIEASDNINTVTDIVNAFFQELSTLKVTDKKKYDSILNYQYLHETTYKALNFLLDYSKEKYLPIIPLVNILIVHRMRNIVSMFIKAMARGFSNFYHGLEDNTVKDAMRDYFMDNISLMGFTEIVYLSDTLELYKHKDIDVLFKLCEDEINYRREKNLGLVLKMIKRVKIKEWFDLYGLIKMATCHNYVDAMYDVIKEDDKYVGILLNSLKPNIHKTHMKNIIKAHNLNHNDFPELLWQQRYSHFKYIIHAFDWSKAEEKASHDIEDLKVLIQILEYKKMINEAYSVYYRHQDKLQDIPELKKYRNDNKYELIGNKLQENDLFMPTSYIKGIESEFQYLLLKDFDIHQSDIHFVTSANLDVAIEYFKYNHTLGIDCEFYNTNSTSFSETKLATMQIATKNQIYIFDCIELIDNCDFKTFVRMILESADYTIIGHTFKSDIDVITHTLKMSDLNVKNVINVERLYSKNNKFGLAKMVSAILNKSLCKFEQTSAWNKRPLRLAQIHYAALDAYVLLELHEQLNNLNNELFDQLMEKEKEPSTLISVEEKEDLLNIKNINEIKDTFQGKFLVDSMLEKLAKHMRNLGLDTDLNKNYTKAEIFDIAKKEKRVILTKNVKLLEKKSSAVVYHLKGGTTEEQIKEIIKSFSLTIKEEELMTRCVTCNSADLIKKDTNEIDEYFEKVEYIKPKSIQDYWVCVGCGQIYWEGAQYSKAKKQFLAHVS